MKLFDVYSQYEVEPVKGRGALVYDLEGQEYLDFYGGHAVISIGHSHPHYVEKITEQIKQLGFYSNAVQNSLQQELADKLEDLSGLQDYSFFFCNSGAEANENALKLASFHTGKTKVIALVNGFHGRTSAAVRATNNHSIQAPINQMYEVEYLPINDIEAVSSALGNKDICAVIVEAIQGIGGCHTCDTDYLRKLEKVCEQNEATLILDEVQCGYGRSGKFFAFQYADIRPGVITVAKGMGNGFPIAGVLINERIFQSKKGLLGTTFGGNHLACAAGIATLDVIKEEFLIEKAEELGQYFKSELSKVLDDDIKILGKGLMIGLQFPHPTAEIRKNLLYQQKVFSGSSGNPNIMRILPPLNVSKAQIDQFIKSLLVSINHFKKT